MRTRLVRLADSGRPALRHGRGRELAAPPGLPSREREGL